MEYFKNRDHVNEYLKMTEEYDGAYIVDKVKKYLDAGATILELGMGPGKDLLLLAKDFNITGSDYSPIFVEDFSLKHPDISVMQLDAIDIETNKEFKCVFSNKVLHHLTVSDFKKSLLSHHRVLSARGIAIFTLWKGKMHEELMEEYNLRFTYYENKDIKNIAEELDCFDIVAIEEYTEIEENDSLFIVMKKR